MSKSLAVVFNKAPYGSNAGRELLDIALMAAAFDMNITAIFIDDGVFQLLKNQQPDILNMKNHSITFKAIELYGIETALISSEDLTQRNLKAEQLLDVAEITPNNSINTVIASSDYVFML